MAVYKAHAQFVFLWENEIRLAAKALRALSDLSEDAPQQEFTTKLREAINTCNAALYGADDEETHLILTTPRAIEFAATYEPVDECEKEAP